MGTRVNVVGTRTSASHHRRGTDWESKRRDHIASIFSAGLYSGDYRPCDLRWSGLSDETTEGRKDSFIRVYTTVSKDVGFRQERISRPNSFSAGDHSRIKASAWKHGSTQRSPPDRTTSVSRRRCGSCRGCWTLAKAGLNSDQDNRVSACVGTRRDECSPMPMLSDLAIHNRVSGVNRVRLELQQVYESCRSLGQRLQWWVTSVWARNRA
jgi:hypothetical protein